MSLLEVALASSHCVMSVMGDHAGEGPDAIFERKMADIKRIGKTFWLIRSPKARPAKVQGICNTNRRYTIFIEPASKGGARPTTEEVAAREYSHDGVSWQQLPKGLSPVTGKLDTGAIALVFDTMTTDIDRKLDLWEYGELSDIPKPLRFILGCSTICAVRRNTKSHPDKMKSHFREIVAVARLADPYCVWLR
jgi:hypothetical protein